MGWCKSQGILAELIFDTEATRRGLKVLKPLLELKYDRMIEWRGRTFRVQVKSTSKPEKNRQGYAVRSCWGGTKKRRYSTKMVDILAVYIVPLDLWYMIPMRKVKAKTIRIFPRTPNKGQFSSYEGAWALFKAKKGAK